MQYIQRNSTAEVTAAMRAIHLLYHQPVLFNDPYCEKIGLRGEHFKSYFEPDLFSDEVSRLGYYILENISPVELNKKYFLNRSDGLVTHSASHIIHAEIIQH